VPSWRAAAARSPNSNDQREPRSWLVHLEPMRIPYQLLAQPQTHAKLLTCNDLLCEQTHPANRYTTERKREDVVAS
jgi:hypothetical protein